MKKKASAMLAIVLVLFLSLTLCCGRREGQETTQSQDMNIPTSEAKAPEPNTTEQMSESSDDQYVQVTAKCVVNHSGYTGIIVAPGVSKPTEGTVVSLECNGEKVEISNNTIVDGYIETKEFGKIGVRFGSMVATVGAGDSISVAEGRSLPQPAIVYVHKSKQKDFMALITK